MAITICSVGTNLDMDLLVGPKKCVTLNVMKIMGAMLHLIFQKKKRMVASGICTKSQYEAGKDELLNRIA